MKVHFRQGIARYQSDIRANPTFLQRRGSVIDLVVSPDPTIIVFAHKNATYIIEEVRSVAGAWGPFTGSVTRYLYWDIDVRTGALTRGDTSVLPVTSGIAPVNPPVDQHWFDLQTTTMKVWNGRKWIECIRVFAATLSSAAILGAPPGFPSSSNSWLGSQAGIVGDFEAGSLVFDGLNQPLRRFDGSFLTSTSELTVASVGARRVRFETELISLLAAENIAKFSLVQVQQGRRAILARSTDIMSRVAGLAIEDMDVGETSTIVTSGIVRNDQWSWAPSTVNRPLFCGPTGEIVLTPATQGVHQQIGYVYDSDAIFVQIFPAIMLDNPHPPDPVPPPIVGPVASFWANPNARIGIAPLNVQFTNSSTGVGNTYQWDFTNDGSVDSTAFEPAFVYTTPGVFSVRLVATNGSGSNTKVETDFITVLPSGGGTNTNLEIRLVSPNRVARNQIFQLTLTTRNDGLQTATNVERTLVIPDVFGPGNSRHAVVVSGLPLGSTNVRANNVTTVTLPLVTSMVSSASNTVSFSVQAPPVNSNINMTARVQSPQVDSTPSDNTTSAVIEVRS